MSLTFPKNSSYFSYESASFFENCAIEFQFDFKSEPNNKYLPLYILSSNLVGVKLLGSRIIYSKPYYK